MPTTTYNLNIAEIKSFETELEEIKKQISNITIILNKAAKSLSYFRTKLSYSPNPREFKTVTEFVNHVKKSVDNLAKDFEESIKSQFSTDKLLEKLEFTLTCIQDTFEGLLYLLPDTDLNNLKDPIKSLKTYLYTRSKPNKSQKGRVSFNLSGLPLASEKEKSKKSQVFLLSENHLVKFKQTLEEKLKKHKINSIDSNKIIDMISNLYEGKKFEQEKLERLTNEIADCVNKAITWESSYSTHIASKINYSKLIEIIFSIDELLSPGGNSTMLENEVYEFIISKRNYGADKDDLRKAAKFAANCYLVLDLTQNRDIFSRANQMFLQALDNSILSTDWQKFFGKGASSCVNFDKLIELIPQLRSLLEKQPQSIPQLHNI